MTKFNYFLELEMRGGKGKKDKICLYFEHINTVKTKTKPFAIEYLKGTKYFRNKRL